MYQANQLVFCIVKCPWPWSMDETDGAPPASDYVVWISDLKTWINHGYSGDDIGGHNIPNQLLKAIGVEDTEEMECQFRIMKGEPDNIKNSLITAGFIYDAAFERFIQR